MGEVTTRVLTVAELRAIDASAGVDIDTLIERAGAAVAATARRMLGGTYGRSVIVLAGHGNNGADGRVAARLLRERGVHVRVIDVSRVSPAPEQLDHCDLVIDAVLGTGSTAVFAGPEQPTAPVLAVDLPSGVDADTGAIAAGSRVMRADRTITFVACKAGLLLGAGAAYAGEIEVADLGLAIPTELADAPGVHRATPTNVLARVPARPRDAHKWSAAVGVVAGSPGMSGAASLVARGASRSGAGMVRVATPGALPDPDPIEAVRIALPAANWTSAAVEAMSRCHALAIGPGLGRSRATRSSVHTLITRAPQAVVLDADAFAALGDQLDDEDRSTGADRRSPLLGTPVAPVVPSAGLRAVQQASARRQGLPNTVVRALDHDDDRAPAAALRVRRPGATVLTPHDGEYERLMARKVGGDRIAAARRLAHTSGCVVLLKGAATVVADATGRAEIVSNGDARLATAGTGDVLTGMIAAFLARGVGAFDAAVIGAFVHAEAARRGRPVGLVAGDLPELVADVLSEWYVHV